MAGLSYAYSLSDEIVEVKDFALASGFTPSKGDVVTLDGTGAVAAPAANATTVLGVFEGRNFQGITKNGPYAATTVTQNSQKGDLAKVRVAGNAVYRVPLKAGATAPIVGTAYGLSAYTAPTLDTSLTGAGAIYKVVDYDANTGNVFVVITGRVLV